MAGQRATAPDGDAGLWPDEEEPIGFSRRARGSAGNAGTGGRRAAREGNRGGEAPRRGPMHPAVPALGLPLVGALVDVVMGSSVGTVFTICAILGAMLAVLWSSRPGWWWVVTLSPLALLVEAFAVSYALHSDKFKGVGMATEGLQAIGHAFPAMVAGMVVALVVIMVRRTRSGRGRRG